ncbi:MAG: sulfurtransferase [Saprospiraceae bacterium]|nr:sulfurtransferase [Saprospiraceae bacterium]
MDHIVSAEWLNDHLNDENLIILDATIPKVGGKLPAEELQDIRIPGARFFDLKGVFIDKESELPNTMPTPDKFAAGCKTLGIRGDSTVIVYDGHGIYSAPRVWYMFKVMGHENIMVLDGGLPHWVSSGYKTEVKTPEGEVKGDIEVNHQPHMICDSSLINEIRNDESYLILDARSEGRFNGTAPEPRKELRGGHIPGSKSLPFTSILKDGVLLDKRSMMALYDQINPEKKRLVFSCGSGITACVIALGAAIADHPVEMVYDGSWSDWGRPSELPVETLED